jgi:predicted nucleic acid-binding protein
VPEEGYEPVRRLPAPLLVSALARVEVAAALWRKHRMGELDLDDALLLNRALAADYAGSPDRPPRFQPVEITDATVERAVERAGTHGLRAYDAVQLACALVAREVDRRCTTLASFDQDLLRAAAAEGFAALPTAETTEARAP